MKRPFFCYNVNYRIIGWLQLPEEKHLRADFKLVMQREIEVLVKILAVLDKAGNGSDIQEARRLYRARLISLRSKTNGSPFSHV